MNYSLLSKYRSELMGVAMLSVMLFHASDMDLGIFNGPRTLGFGGVDIFVLLSAMGLAMSLTRRRQEYGAFLIRRARRVLPAYYLVMAAYTLALLVRKQATVSAFFWNATLLQYWVRPQGRFNWYMTGLLIWYALIPPLTALMGRSRHRAALTVLISAAGIAVCELLYRDGYWYYMDPFFRLPVLAEGILLGFLILEDRRLGARDYAVWGLCVAAGALWALVWLKGWTVWAAYMFPFTTVPACLLICLVLDRLPLGALRRCLRFVGENSLEIYLLNVSFFSETGLLRRFFDPDPGHYAYYAASFALNILLGWALHRAIALVGDRLRVKAPTNSPPSGHVIK